MNGHTSYLKAVQEVPAKLKSMYINSLQSYLWNCAASHRIQVYGATNVVLGDLVIPRSQPSASPGITSYSPLVHGLSPDQDQSSSLL